MTVTEQIITIALCALATMLTRFLPFPFFSGKRKTPEYITYLGKALPAAIFGMLVVYCLNCGRQPRTARAYIACCADGDSSVA